MRWGGPDRQLSYAVRPRTVARHYGDLLLILAALNAVPMTVALIVDGWVSGLWYAISVAILGAAGGVLHRLSPGRGLQTNEALAVAAAAFVTAALVISVPLMHAGLAFMDALFESISGVTTTGLTTTATMAGKPAGFLFTRAWLQWYGGFGIVVLSVALVLQPGGAARRLAAGEGTAADLAVDTRAHARRVLVVYLVLTGAAIATLLLVGLRSLAAVTYSLSAVSTGGFAIDDASLAGVNGWTVRGLVLLFSLLGAVSFSMYYQWFRGRPRRAPWRDVNVLGLVIITILAAIALTLCLRFEGSAGWGEAIRQGLSLGVSGQTTTGFSTMDVSRLPPAAKAVQILSMFIGGDVGSTAGGIKIFRFLVALRILQHLLARSSVTAHTVLPRRLAGQDLPDSVAVDALLLIGLFIATIFLSWTLFLVYGYQPLDALYDVVSATCTVGLSTGVTGPSLPALLKGVLCVDMMLGRLEVVAVLVLFYPRTWLGKRVSAS